MIVKAGTVIKIGVFMNVRILLTKGGLIKVRVFIHLRVIISVKVSSRQKIYKNESLNEGRVVVKVRVVY